MRIGPNTALNDEITRVTQKFDNVNYVHPIDPNLTENTRNNKVQLPQKHVC